MTQHTLAVFLAAASLAFCAPAQAQDRVEELARDNARLKAKVRMLEARLEAFERILEEQVARLERLEGSRGGSTGPVAAKPNPASELQAEFKRLSQRYGVAKERLGEHELLKQYRHRLEVLQSQLRAGRLDYAHKTVRFLKDHLVAVENAEAAKKKAGAEPTGRAKTHEGIKQAFAQAKEQKNELRQKEFGMFLEFMGDGFQGEWLKAQYQMNAQRLGRGDERVREYGKRLGILQRLVDEGKVEEAFAAFQALREALDALEK